MNAGSEGQVRQDCQLLRRIAAIHVHRRIGLTANVPPVTDNYPLRISSRQTDRLERVPLYETLMDETERLARFGQSQFIARLWPEDLRDQSKAFFRYERMIRNHIMAATYQVHLDPNRWQAIDELLTNTALETLPLWLLGSDQDVQSALDNLPWIGERGAEVTLELAFRDVSERAYAAARERLEPYMTASNSVRPSIYTLYLYALAKSDRLGEASVHIVRLDADGRARPDVERFLNWFTTKFELSSLKDGERMSHR